MQLCWRIIDELARAVGVAVGRHYSGRLVTTLVATLFFLFPLLSTFLIEGVLKLIKHGTHAGGHVNPCILAK